LPKTPEPLRPATERTEPGTWREIIARFERELGAVTDAETEAEVETPPEAAEPAAIEPGVGPPTAAAQPSGAAAEEGVGDEPADADEDAGSLAPPVAWEFEAMTTPDYTPPRSIHDPQHDSWPVEAEDGTAIPAWSSGDEDDTPGADVSHDENGEMTLDEGARPDPWDLKPEDDQPAGGDFPLNAFIVPAGVPHVPSGYGDREVARRVAHRLDELARQLRAAGLGSLGTTNSVDELSRVLAAIVTGYVARDG
jgi:hypothetical protein